MLGVLGLFFSSIKNVWMPKNANMQNLCFSLETSKRKKEKKHIAQKLVDFRICAAWFPRGKKHFSSIYSMIHIRIEMRA